MTEKRQISQGYIRILQHFATKLRNITNFVMLFQAVMKFLSRLVWIKILVIRGKVNCDITFLTVFILTHPVNFPCGRKPEASWSFRPLAVLSPCRFVPLTFPPKLGHHPKIGRTNVGGILHHSARLRKQKT
jgi:hypothetical protein